MQVVTCFQCARQTMIAPNAYICPNCGEDLQHLLLPETVAAYFQARAHESSERGELGAALAEAERGLTYADSSELRLLAAILAKQLGRHDRMRQHVAAIPVDDSLRNEAEWLLRSHQDRERALSEATRQTPLPAPLPVLPESGTTFLEELLGGNSTDTATTKRTHVQSIASVALVMVALTLIAASWWWIGPGIFPENEPDGDPVSGVGGVAPSGGEPAALPLVATTASTSPSTSPSSQEVQVASTPALLPTATPTPSIPADLVQVAAETPELADSNPSHVILVETTRFDMRQYLREQGRPDLAELAIDGFLQKDTLLLQGIIHLDVQRGQILAIAATIPGVNAVNDVNLLLRPLATYTVEDGDTLWSIVYNIYGNVDRLDEFAAYNRDVLPSPDALAPGIELKVLPIQ